MDVLKKVLFKYCYRVLYFEWIFDEAKKIGIFLQTGAWEWKECFFILYFILKIRRIKNFLKENKTLDFLEVKSKENPF